MDQLAKTFEDLIRRMLGPATSFFVFLFVFHAIESLIKGSVDHCWILMWCHKTNPDPMASLNLPNPTILISLGVIALVGMSYALATLQEAFYDNWLRGSFACSEKKFTNLRAKAVAKLKRLYDKNEFGEPLDNEDYYLYEIIGGIDQSSTTRFVDNAKTYGIVFLSSALAALSILVCERGCLYWIVCFIVAFIMAISGYYLTKAQYRWRAVRLYVNLIMMPEEKITGILADYKRQNQKEPEAKPTTPTAETQ